MKAIGLLFGLLTGCADSAREPETPPEQTDGSRSEALEALERGDMDQFVAEMREETDRVRQWAEGIEQEIERGAHRFSEEEQELFEAIQRDLNDVEEHLERFVPTRAQAGNEARAIQRRMRQVADQVQELEARRAAPQAP